MTAKSALEQRKLELEVEQLELGNRKLLAEARKAEVAAESDSVYLTESQERHLERKQAKRVHHFTAVVEPESVCVCMDAIDNMIRLDPDGPIEIVFNSPGGSVTDGLELYDFILAKRAAGATINTTALGVAASMAGILIQAGATRRIGANAYLMVHELATFSLGKLSEIKDATEFAERLYNRTASILASRSNLPVEEIKERSDRRNWWLDADEALEFGLVDEILPTVVA